MASSSLFIKREAILINSDYDYDGMTLLSCTYKVLSNIIYQRILLHIERELVSTIVVLREEDHPLTKSLL